MPQRYTVDLNSITTSSQAVHHIQMLVVASAQDKDKIFKEYYEDLCWRLEAIREELEKIEKRLEKDKHDSPEYKAQDLNRAEMLELYKKKQALGPVEENWDAHKKLTEQMKGLADIEHRYADQWATKREDEVQNIISNLDELVDDLKGPKPKGGNEGGTDLTIPLVILGVVGVGLVAYMVY